jgi:hypothetical protein
VRLKKKKEKRNKLIFGMDPWFSIFLKISKVAFLTTGWFFHENCRFFDVSDVTGTGNSLILIVSLNERTDGSLILTSSIMFV